MVWCSVTHVCWWLFTSRDVTSLDYGLSTLRFKHPNFRVQGEQSNRFCLRRHVSFWIGRNTKGFLNYITCYILYRKNIMLFWTFRHTRTEICQFHSIIIKLKFGHTEEPQSNFALWKYIFHKNWWILRHQQKICAARFITVPFSFHE